MRVVLILILFFAIVCTASSVFPQDGETESPFWWGGRYYFDIYSPKHDYLEDQLGRFGLEDKSPAFGIHLAFYGVAWHNYLEAAFGFDFGRNRKLFEDKSHNVVFQTFCVEFAYRRGFEDVFRPLSRRAPKIDVLPGVSLAYLPDANVIIQDNDRDDWTEILYRNGWGYSAGIEFRCYFIFVEYRYRWRKITGMEPIHGGEYFFPGDPEMDFSGHFVGFGLDVDGVR